MKNNLSSMFFVFHFKNNLPNTLIFIKYNKSIFVFFNLKSVFKNKFKKTYSNRLEMSYAYYVSGFVKPSKNGVILLTNRCKDEYLKSFCLQCTKYLDIYNPPRSCLIIFQTSYKLKKALILFVFKVSLNKLQMSYWMFGKLT